ncbi:bifunctional adenosylcobinamide kinase/adenosylcobinamide-phosphate guanylyltransferase [Paracoccus jiaweipingae]|uniref:bifunctional adenosylcobinamide kinase/adenosylcobinamide-phosphate guanylyltransferase n=1 Tax=unclassified Paracoccus (in: a-proteobacteria) TaxID=2688777 RepID=UPI0037A0C4C2
MDRNTRIILVTGGARSGKTAIAERLACHYGGPGRPVYIATAQPWDAEMAARIATHRQDRGSGWDTHEAPRDLPAALAATDRPGGPARLIDCLTLWMTNHLPEPPDLPGLLAALQHQQAPVILVSNELGQGIVPDNALARRFRDDHGRMNQRVAAIADQVWLAVAGQPLQVKPTKGEFP